MAADDRGPQLATVLVAFLVLTIVSAILRCYSMGILLKRFYIEDWLAIVSLVGHNQNCLLPCTAAHLSRRLAIDKHITDTDSVSTAYTLPPAWLASTTVSASTSSTSRPNRVSTP